MYKYLPHVLIGFGLILIVGSYFFGASNTLPNQELSAAQLTAQANNASKLNLVFFIGVMDVAAGLCLLWFRSRANK